MNRRDHLEKKIDKVENILKGHQKLLDELVTHLTFSEKGRMRLDDKAIKLQEISLSLMGNVIGVIKRLRIYLYLAIFVINILVWKVFLSGITRDGLALVWGQFSDLPESYKNTILGVIMGFFSIIFSSIIVHLIIKRLEKTSKNI